MPEYISPDFEPSKETYRVLQTNGIPKEFLDLYVTEHFIEYWTERKEKAIAGELTKTEAKSTKKTAWQTTYRVWARRAFHGKLGREYEERRHWRQGGGSLGSDLFGKTLEKLSAKAEDEPAVMAVPQNYRLPDPPEPGPAMDPLEALAEARKILGDKK